MMLKKWLTLLSATLLLSLSLPAVSAADSFNDGDINWDEHTQHSYDTCEDAACNVCGAVRPVSGHRYDGICDADCNECGALREPPHSYDDACDADCNACGAVRTPQHVYDNDCDTTCNACGTVRTVGAHHYRYPCATECDLCGAPLEPLSHTYDNGCDTDCNFCSFVREVPHIYDNACDATCNKCGAVRAVGSHVYDSSLDADCNECGFTRGIATILAQPAIATYAAQGDIVRVSFTAAGDGLTYQWYLKNAGDTAYAKSSVTGATYSARISDKSHNRRLYCVVRDAYGNQVRTETVLIRRRASILTEPATAASRVCAIRCIQASVSPSAGSATAAGAVTNPVVNISGRT